jgi:quinol monooxygenase YgiN
MHAIAGVLRFPPEMHDDIVVALHDVAERSRADTGCVDYWWAAELDEPGAFRFFECWENEDVFQAHLAAPYEQEFNERILVKLVSAQAWRYEVSGRRSVNG